MQDSHYHAFLASRMYPKSSPSPLNDLRRDIHRLGQRLNRLVWVAESAAPEYKGKPPEEVQIACMKHVREIPGFICIIDGTYGSPWNLAQLCVLELEIISATLAGKPFQFFLLEPYEPDPRTESLRRVVSLVRPEIATMTPQPAKAILERVRDWLSDTRRLQESKTPSLEPSGVPRSMADLDIEFLDGKFFPLDTDQPDEKREKLIRDLLSDPSSKVDQATRLVHLWMAIRHLCATPYDAPEYERFVPLWNQALSRWSSAAAWYGLHGINYLGRLAAVRTMLRIQERCNSSGEISIHGGKGALASEYYSISKTVRSRKLKRKLLEEALTALNESFQKSQSDPSGLRSIRGSVLLALGRLKEAICDYEAVLEQRKDEESGRIGEAEAKLGWGYFRLWLPWRIFDLSLFLRAQHLLTHGVSLLEQSDRHEFTVRAMRQLGAFYILTLRPWRARRVMEQAYNLARRREMNDQLRQMQFQLQVLRRLTWLAKV